MSIYQNDLARRLPPLPPSYVMTGYEWIGTLPRYGWRAISSWGSEGWDLGDWPYVIVAACHPTNNLWGLGQYVEGDLSLWGFTEREDLHSQIDTIAEFYWRMDYNPPHGLPSEGLGPQHKGPYPG